MPFVRTAVRQGTDASQKQLIVESIHNALVQAIGMPEDELFNLVSEYNASDFLYRARSTVLPARITWSSSRSQCGAAAAMP
jgi:phenylpyruvate tautomerase PptA (4-oxalocrotonate tautomerase family)